MVSILIIFLRSRFRSHADRLVDTSGEMRKKELENCVRSEKKMAFAVEEKDATAGAPEQRNAQRVEGKAGQSSREGQWDSHTKQNES